MNILVSGAAGFIGSHLCDSLIEAGHKVIGIDNLSSGLRENLNSNISFSKMDIRDTSILKNIFIHNQIDYVFHLAAQINLRESIKNPIIDANINIIGSLNIINECIKNKVKNFIFISTGGAMYEFTGLPSKETDLPKPASPYGLNKYYIESFFLFSSNLYGLNYNIFRLANVFGVRQNPHGECGVLSIFLDRINKGLPLKIFGSGNQTRDFIDVWSTVDALMLGLNKLEKNNVFNVSSNIQVSVNDIVNMLQLYFPSLEIENHPPIIGEMLSTQLDNSKLLETNLWQPKYNLEQALRKTINL